MNYGLLEVLTLVGSLGLFLYGMKLMSESLQKVAGNKMRDILASMTSNRVKGVLTGVLITSLVQSSSATTVMVVSFVNAGLLTLKQSIGVIMGANVGTTVTAWIITYFGFKMSMSTISLPLIGLALPLLFSSKRSRKSWGELIIGFSLLFIGLDFLKHSVPDINSNPQMLEFLKDFNNPTMSAIFMFMFIGTVLTILIQSSSAAMALTLVMCNEGWISFELAAAMVLGQNIGTTITANLAAMVANTSAKRAARAHLVFNVLGVLLALVFFNPSMHVLDGLVRFLGVTSPFPRAGEAIEATQHAMPIALSIYHTMFNILNTLVLIWFTKPIADFVTKITPIKDQEDEEFHLKHIKTGLLSTPEASLYVAKQEMVHYAEITQKMFKHLEKLYKEEKDKGYSKRLSKIEKYEDSCDNMELEIATFLTKVSETKLSERSSEVISAYYKAIDNIESIADSCNNIARHIDRKRGLKLDFPEMIEKKISIMSGYINDAIAVMIKNISSDDTVNMEEALSIEREIDNYRNILKSDHLINLENKVYDYQVGIIYNDIFSEYEKMGDYIINVTQSLKTVK
ncbi:Na/Pi cotransporter family protein [Halosquirtibacter xylanolyticus]|uniref:Na/Pi cotransporter family protein n=1 Tax=Halosquirtibacter xylanolyticus TaxID=3374599 RepID=UPI0037494C20|nr:Na/Pi cotransporter family protein [Prolixibacteraceae bacterium]